MSLVEFKSWWGDWSGSDKLPENTDIRYAFEAGQQSQLAKINELQARIDIALALIDTTSYSEIERRLPDFIEQLKDSLKGNKDEN